MAIDEIIRYVYVTFIVATLFFIPIMFIRGMYLRRKGRWPIKNWKKEIAVILFIFYLLCLYQITALRFGGIGWDISNMIARNTRVNMTPMVENYGIGRSRVFGGIYFIMSLGILYGLYL